MTQRILIPLLLLLVCVPAAAQQTTLECPFNDIGGDLLFRGWYVPSFPSDTLALAELQFFANVPGDFTVLLTARSGEFGGPLIDVTSAVISVTDPVFGAELQSEDHDSAGYFGDIFSGRGLFDFGAAPVELFSTVAFTFNLLDTPPGSPFLFFDVGPCAGGDTRCDICNGKVIETEGTQPPLDMFRRASVGVIFSEEEKEPVPALGVPGLAILAGLLLLLPVALRRLQ